MATAQEFNSQVVITLGSAQKAIAVMREILEKHTDVIHKLVERIEILEEKGKQQ